MKILIIGGGGMVGQKLAQNLSDNPLSDADEVTLFDLTFPEASAPGAQITGNVSDADAVKTLLDQGFDLIFHLVAIVSGEAESNFPLGWDVNMQAFRMFLETLRAQHEASGQTYVPRVVFTSSIAVFGPPYPTEIPDDFPRNPQTSYGAQKAISELMLTDYIRRGFIDGLAIRLPTIVVRPGKANLAASSFFSGIIREPLNGQTAILPVPDDVRHWHASPKSAAGFLRHAATLDLDQLGNRRALNMPGVSCTVAEQIEALREAAGNEAVALIKRVPNELIMKIVEGWPRNFAPTLALELGFTADPDFASIIRTYIDEDLPNA